MKQKNERWEFDFYKLITCPELKFLQTVVIFKICSKLKFKNQNQTFRIINNDKTWSLKLKNLWNKIK